MVTGVELYMAWAHTLLTILNSVYLVVLFKGGVQSEYHIITLTIFFIPTTTTTTTRCLAHRLNLDIDDPQLVCRCHELSRAFIQSLTIKELWNDYGIVDGILV